MYIVREVRSEDLFSVFKIAYETLPEPYNPDLFNIFYEEFPSGFLVAEMHGRVVGFIVGVKTDLYVAKILMLSVSKEYRRCGIGSALINRFIKEMRLQHIRQIDLEVRSNNYAAIDFYKKHDFDVIDFIPGFYKDGQDAYVMRKIL